VKTLRLVAFDMEGTLTTDPTLWEIMHRKLGTWESHGARYWRRYCAGELAYDDFARLDVAAWKGAASALLDQAAAEVPLMPGCRELLDALHCRGIRTAIISNGLLRLARRLKRECGVSCALANREIVRRGSLTGGLDILVPYEAKGAALQRLMTRFRARKDQTAAVGDSRADCAMFDVAGLGIAFRPSDAFVRTRGHHVVEAPDLRQVGAILLNSA